MPHFLPADAAHTPPLHFALAHSESVTQAAPSQVRLQTGPQSTPTSSASRTPFVQGVIGVAVRSSKVVQPTRQTAAEIANQSLVTRGD